MADAHRLNVFAYPEGERIIAEAYFASGSRCIECKVEVSDSKGRVLLKGQTDKEGIYDFAVPAIDDLSIAVRASMGHRGVTNIPAEDLPSAAKMRFKKNPEKSNAEGSTKVVRVKPKSKPIEPVSEATIKSCDMDAIRKIVREEIAAGIKPLSTKPTRPEDEDPKLLDIISGLGYLIGIFGLWALFSRRKSG